MCPNLNWASFLVLTTHGPVDHTATTFSMSISGKFDEDITNESFGVNDTQLFIKVKCDVSCQKCNGPLVN